MLSAPNFQRGNTPSPGDHIKARSFADLSNAITGARSILGPGQTQGAYYTAGGIVSLPDIAVRTTSTVKTPFQITCVSAGGGNYNVSLYPGTVNQQIPSDIFTTLNTTLNNGANYVVITCGSDGYGITTMTWESGGLMTSQPTPQEATADTPPSTFYIIIGVIFYNSSNSTFVIYQIVTTNLTAEPTVWTTTTRPSAGPYDLAALNYYYWVVGAE